MGFNKTYLPDIELLKEQSKNPNFYNSVIKTDVFIGTEECINFINNYIEQNNELGKS